MMAWASLFDRWIARPRSRWPGWAICTALLCLPVVLAVAEVGSAAAVGQPGFRGQLIAPAVITYILLVSPLLTRTADPVILGLRPLLDFDEPSFPALVEANSRVGSGRERRAVADGAWLGAQMAYERRLESARTWPYNTAMLQTLALLVFVPLATIVARRVAERIFGQRPEG